ncbi:MAG: type VI secretion system protein ImpK [Myxococcota bacterium]|jgi:type VI secretion system protein ImpK
MAEQTLARVAGDYIALVQLIGQAPVDRLPEVAALGRQMRGLLEEVKREAGSLGFDAAEVEEARFALAVWGDETVLKSEWDGRQSWHTEMLQSTMFRTTRGGNEFYERLKALDPEQQDAREVFVVVLAMGFEGQYMGQDEQRRAIISHQFKTLRSGGRGEPLDVEGPIMPSAYELDIELPRSGGLSLAATFGIGVAGLVGVYLLFWLVLYMVAGDVPLPPSIS